ncbi:MAG: threonine--tRNA ligase, partial [Candidatus Eremiobacteraeota bacterium]|nr:threonine--tRNA ligase [Candidatus Eremiobacteraeota bacterium]
PIQVMMIPVTDKQVSYAENIQKILRDSGFRVEVDKRKEKVGFKIREAQMEKIPYMVIVGPKEEEAKQVSVRHRKKGDLGKMSLEDFISKMKKEVETKE